MLPFLKVHLLGQRADHVAVRAVGLGDSVWHEAHSSDCLMCGASSCTKPVTDRMMVRRPASIGVRAVDRRAPSGGVGVTTKLALKLSGVPSRPARSGGTPCRRCRRPPAGAAGAVAAADRQVREHLAGAARRRARCAVDIGMWQAAHSSWIAAACCGWSIVSRRTAACQYGSRAELAIIVARHVDADRHVLAGGRRQVVVAGDAVLRVREQRQVAVRIRGRAVPAGCRSSARGATRNIDDSQAAQASGQRVGERPSGPVPTAHFQNWNRPPSNQSHST